MTRSFAGVHFLERRPHEDSRRARHFKSVLKSLHAGVKYVIVGAPNQKKEIDKPSYSEDAKEFCVDEQLRRDLEQAAEAEWKAIGY